MSFQSLFLEELEKRKSESDSNYDQNVDKYPSLITEFIENLLANSGRSFLILIKKTGVSDAVSQIIVEMRKELGISMLNPLHNHIKDVADFIEKKNSLYSNNQSENRDPVGALYTGSV